jgi:hypothetical protein
MFPAFFCFVSFTVAEPRSAILAGGGNIPDSWTAGVMNHGSYYKWWMPSDRPFFFAISCATLFVCLGYLFWSSTRESRKRMRFSENAG